MQKVRACATLRRIFLGQMVREGCTSLANILIQRLNKEFKNAYVW